MSKRFLTIEENDGTVHAFTESEDWKSALDGLDVADWVWQFADDKEQAKEQHATKNDQWRDEINAGLPERDTY